MSLQLGIRALSDKDLAKFFKDKPRISLEFEVKNNQILIGTWTVW